MVVYNIIQKISALESMKKIGLKPAARELNIPLTTLKRWRRKSVSLVLAKEMQAKEMQAKEIYLQMCWISRHSELIAMMIILMVVNLQCKKQGCSLVNHSLISF